MQIWIHLCMLMIEKKILILCKSPIQGLGDTKSTAEKEHAINFYEQQNKSCLSLYYNGEKRFFFLLMDLKYIKSKQKILK